MLSKGEFLFYEGAHPHYNYYACADCGEKFTDGSTTTLSDCEQCHPPCTEHVEGEFSHCGTEHPHYLCFYCNRCDERFRTTRTTSVEACDVCHLKEVEYDGLIGPSILEQGDTLYFEGTFTSPESELVEVSVLVLDSNDELVLEERIPVRGYTFDLEELNGLVAFDRLPVGDYLLLVDGSNRGYGLTVNHPFKVVSRSGLLDVSSGAWYYEAIRYVLDRGIMSGYNAATFGPDDTLSRAMVVQVLYNSATETATRAQTAQILMNYLRADE